MSSDYVLLPLPLRLLLVLVVVVARMSFTTPSLVSSRFASSASFIYLIHFSVLRISHIHIEVSRKEDFESN